VAAVESLDVLPPVGDVRHLERVQQTIGDDVAALAGQMPSDAVAEGLPRLPDVDRLLVVVVEGVDADAAAKGQSAGGVERAERFAPPAAEPLQEGRAGSCLGRLLLDRVVVARDAFGLESRLGIVASVQGGAESGGERGP